MEKQKVYPDTCFPPEVVCEAVDVLTSFIEEENLKPSSFTRRITLENGERWSHDTDEEFFADYTGVYKILKK